MILGIILIFLAFISIGIHMSNRDTGIGLNNQIIMEKNKELKDSKQKSYAIGFAIGIILGFIITGNVFLTLVAGAGAAFIIGEKLYNAKKERRIALLSEQYSQALSSIISSLEAGSNPYQALEEAVLVLKNPSRGIFLEILRKNRTGTNYHQAIALVAEESGWKDLKQIEVAFRLYNRSGSDLVAVCNYLLQTAYEAKADRKYIAGITSQIRVTGLVLSSMPFFLMGAMRFMAPEFVYPLYHEFSGIIVVTIVIALIIIGNKIMSRMINSIY